MPFPANWLEELVIEWLDLDGFAISTSVSINASAGGRLTADVVGAKLDGRCVLIRHCEAAMHLIQGPGNELKRYKAKFSERMQKAVEDHFVPLFGEERKVLYEKWIVTFRPSDNVQIALKEGIDGVKICTLQSFVFGEVIPTIKRFKNASKQFKSDNKSAMQLPGDKWLLHMIDWLEHLNLLSLQ